nr:MAG TPA: hypothetical protein [Caudoviricetes sp.]DAR97225.1 MAG TPA: hypothetical protein [Caudoviricetes sp.]
MLSLEVTIDLTDLNPKFLCASRPMLNEYIPSGVTDNVF